MPNKTPMMQQYESIKQSYQDCILFFRLGDFYEMFLEDAHKASSVLGITLTSRGGTPMCGVPYHSAKNYIRRLIQAGLKVAICEQTSLPGQGKIVQREVTEVLTPGTVLDEDFLDSKEENYVLAFLALPDSPHAMAGLEVTTGKLFLFKPEEAKDLSQGPGHLSAAMEGFRKQLLQRRCREVLIPEQLAGDHPLRKLLVEESKYLINEVPVWQQDLDRAVQLIQEQFQLPTLRSIGFQDDEPGLLALSWLIEYFRTNVPGTLSHIREIEVILEGQGLYLDSSTLKNLEIFQNLSTGGPSHTLLSVLDKTKTAQGGRTLKHWLQNPLRLLAPLKARQERVSWFTRDFTELQEYRKTLSKILDLPRLTGRLAMKKAHPKDLMALSRTCMQIVYLFDQLEGQGWPYSQDLAKHKTLLSEISAKIEAVLVEDPPVLMSAGGLVREGHSPELDRLRALKENAHSVLEDYRLGLQTETGIPNLKLKYNKILGYFFEVTKSQASLIPLDVLRKQSLVNGERFTTEKLNTLEKEILSADDRSKALEKQIFDHLLESLLPEVPPLLTVGQEVGVIDALQSLAYVALEQDYTLPNLVEEDTLELFDSRHPVVEQTLPPGQYIKNDLVFADQTRLFLLTGPNMAGKSTLLRQVALAVYMAQIGSYIPASRGTIGLVDKLFCRVGASDNLARGESTFLVEMSEAAHILSRASRRSLIIMDEVGRGTTTNDGLAIAWAITEYLLHKSQSKTLFATHFHELTALDHPGFQNASMAVKESGTGDNQDILFLRKLIYEPAGRSYGIHVAKLAGLPPRVIQRARDLLTSIEKGQLPRANTASLAEEDTGTPMTAAIDAPTDRYYHRSQPGNLFDPLELTRSELLSLNLNEITPLDALNLLSKWKNDLS
jgi:DNA mismatch repair protein MutS